MQTNKELIRKSIEEGLRNRLATLNLKGKAKKTEEVAFLCGAMSALQVVFGENVTELTNYIPPIWVIASMTGRSVLDETTNKGK